MNLRRIIQGIKDEWQYTIINVVGVSLILAVISFSFIMRAIISARVGMVEDAVQEIKIATAFVGGILVLLISFWVIMLVPIAKEEGDVLLLSEIKKRG